MLTISLKKNEDWRIRAGHPWVYSNEIDTQKSLLKNFQSGELVKVISASGDSLGVGYINPHNLLSVRILSRECKTKIDDKFFESRIQSALKMREQFFDKPFYRLVYGDSDLLPGLTVDRFNDVFVVQLTTSGMDRFKEVIIDTLRKMFSPRTIIMRNDLAVRELEGLKRYSEVAFGERLEECEIEENGVRFIAPVLHGQKTGWFYDQRQNHARTAYHSQNKRVLDVFSYLGGFGIQCAANGAKEVLCIDSSAKALHYAQESAKLSGVENKLRFIEDDAVDAMKRLNQEKEKFDLVIIDPPAYIKKRKDIAAGTKAYHRLQELALNLLNENGLLVSTSCSMHFTRDMFLNVIAKLRNPVRIIEQLHQSIDHPIYPIIPETEYLKGFIVVTI